MSLKAKLVSMSAHPIYGKLFTKLTSAELDMIAQFVADNAELSKDDYMFKANRLFIDGVKPKHHVDMWSIITQVREFK